MKSETLLATQVTPLFHITVLSIILRKKHISTKILKNKFHILYFEAFYRFLCDIYGSPIIEGRKVTYRKVNLSVH